MTNKNIEINSRVLIYGDNDIWVVSQILNNGNLKLEKEKIINGMKKTNEIIKNPNMIRKIISNKVSNLVENLLLEVGETVTPYKYTLSQSGIDAYIGKFKTESGLNYIVNATFLGDTKIMIQFLTEEHGEKETNKGEFFKVMSTVINIIKEIFKREPTINEIEFYGKEKVAGETFSQRTNVYIKYAQKILGSNWKIKQKGNQINLIKKK